MVYSDPKPGRWILPLMIVAMVVLTYTFVNSIEPAESPTGSPVEPPFTTVPPEPTTTLPDHLAQFMVTLDIWENQVSVFATQLTQDNNRWEDRANTGVTFAQTRTAFLNLQTQLRNFETEVAQAANVPPEVATEHLALLLQVGNLPLKMEEVILGLDAPDDGTLRRAAVAEFHAEVTRVLEAIEDVRRAVRGEEPETTTTLPNGEADEENDADEPEDETEG